MPAAFFCGGGSRRRLCFCCRGKRCYRALLAPKVWLPGSHSNGRKRRGRALFAEGAPEADTTLRARRASLVASAKVVQVGLGVVAEASDVERLP